MFLKSSEIDVELCAGKHANSATAKTVEDWMNRGDWSPAPLCNHLSSILEHFLGSELYSAVTLIPETEWSMLTN